MNEGFGPYNVNYWSGCWGGPISSDFTFTCCSFPPVGRTPRPETFQPGLEHAWQMEVQIRRSEDIFLTLNGFGSVNTPECTHTHSTYRVYKCEYNVLMSLVDIFFIYILPNLSAAFVSCVVFILRGLLFYFFSKCSASLCWSGKLLNVQNALYVFLNLVKYNEADYGERPWSFVTFFTVLFIFFLRVYTYGERRATLCFEIWKECVHSFGLSYEILISVCVQLLQPLRAVQHISRTWKSCFWN